ncbi:MAG: Crp/Fnr family transcriptional regulator [Proteobacteria bacterium]|nr:Crp/Fnr family transcriptional regulator [Pseudomonadota bacterium]
MDKEQALERLGKAYEPGAVLFYEGDPGSKLWVINEGHVQLTRRVCSEDIVIETLGPGEFCGELALVTGDGQPTTATVVDAARILVVEASQFETLIRSNGELSIRMLKKLAGRLNEAHFRISVLQMRNTLGRVMLQLLHEIEHSEANNKATIPVDLAYILGIDEAELKGLIDKLLMKNLITLSKENVYSIVDREEYERFMNYLALGDRYAYLDK